MNITTSVVERNKNLKDQINREGLMREAVGINYYKRIISIYPSVSKNIHNIDGNNVLLSSKCMIINYSISQNQKIPNATLFNKTTYICDLNFPGNITPEMLMMPDISKILSNASIEPIYAFNNPHYEKSDNKYIDLGLTMVDLNSVGDCGVINFSQNNNDEKRDYIRDIVTPEYFNPKLYIPQEKEFGDNNCTKHGVITDFIDNHTSIIKDVHNYKRNIKVYKNGIERTDRVINKRTLKTNELLLDIFSDIIFLPIEDLDMIIDTVGGINYNIRKFTTFKRFNNEINKYYYSKTVNSILKTVKNFRNIMNGENFYINIQKSETLFSLNVAFNNKDNSVDEIRITNPIYKLYSQFALNNESIVNNIENDIEYSKACLIEDHYNSENTIRGLINNINAISDNIKNITTISQQIDNYKIGLISNHYDNKQKLIE